ncbi:MAG: Gfo/Idh/MocA family oxidoreductase [Pirellulales bacterium]|nr:Gfo/Idh/MocA family oxidoreductase [Pirellulales bacterium]
MSISNTEIESRRTTRRQILRAGAAAMAAATVFRVRPTSAAALTDQLRIAVVGVGNRGWADLQSVASATGARIVAVCDVDSNFLDQATSVFDKANAFRDYRQMLDDRGKEIDAVLISTPDHMHGAISLAAMSLGKHVYVQKPLAHNLAELRQMMNVAAEKKLVTQMGTQIHAEEAYRTAVKALREGVIGKVREAHSWIGRTLPLPANKRPAKGDPVPNTLDWELWQGVAPEYPYANELYHPFNWRMWRDYGCGILGDMGCHLFDPLFGGLELRAPIAVKSLGPPNSPDTFAPDNDVTFTFAGTRYTAGEMTIRWTNGVIESDSSKAQLPAGVTLPDSGSFVVGEGGVMVLPHWSMPTFYRDGGPLEVSVEPAGRVDHYHEWVAACRGEGETSTPFSYGGVVTEAVLLGTISSNFPEKSLRWDAKELKFDDEAATAMVHRKYRDGWRPAGV